MVRKYGMEPYTIVTVHGGPGARGSMAGLSKELSNEFGVLEPIQTEYNIENLLEELKKQIIDNTTMPVTLIGHSWGAWLTALFAEKYPALVKKVILIGSGPLDAKYANLIGERRRSNLSAVQRKEYDELVNVLEQEDTLNKDEKLCRLGELADLADNYHKILLTSKQDEELTHDGEAYSRIWPEAAKLRKSGQLLKVFKNIICPITIIQGDVDPHPYEGIVRPLLGQKVNFVAYSIEKCGHTPWVEKFGVHEFYCVLLKELLDQG